VYADVGKWGSPQPDHDRRAVGDGDVRKLTSAMLAARLAAQGTRGGLRSSTRQTGDPTNDAPAQKQEEARKRQEEVRRRQEEILKRSIEEGRKQEREGIARRQQESDSAARALRHRHAGLQQLPAPTATSRSSNALDPSPGQLLMPLESPSRDEVSDSESFKPSRYLLNDQSHSHRQYVFPLLFFSSLSHS
jgi:hypothetical protein